MRQESRKRSQVSDERKKQLEAPHAVYVISCHEDEYYCKSHPEGRCYRGFFSMFLQALYGIKFAQKYGVEYAIDFGNLQNSYSTIAKPNFWNSFFQSSQVPENAKQVHNARYENFPLCIWDRGFIKELHGIYQREVKLLDNIKEATEGLRHQFARYKTLGIHIRKTDHYKEVKPATDNLFLTKVHELLPAYDRLFVASDDAQVLKDYHQRFPQQVISQDFIRSSNGQALHADERYFGYELGKQALLDCYALSFCDYLILSPSNLSYTALVLNPEVPYKIVESRQAKLKRWKTILVYQLNKWGIRKW